MRTKSVAAQKQSSIMKSFTEILRTHAQQKPDACAFAFLTAEGAETRVNYGDLERRSLAIAVRLLDAGAAGEPVLILLQPGPDFVAAIFGCLFAGSIMTPCAVPRRADRAGQLRAIAADSGARFAIGAPPFAEDPGFPDVQWISPDAGDGAQLWRDTDLWRAPEPRPDQLALLQYTSGSTGTPRGVMVTHGNLIANAHAIEEGFRHPTQEWGVTWLPPYHDMGLMGGILQPVFYGSPSAVLSPPDFARRPALWLDAVSRYRARTSGGPNFAYEYCARTITEEESCGFDLSHWKLAYVGAEPVRSETLDLFARRFAPNGFHRHSFFPCYGLAEGTLYVSGSRPHVRHFSGSAIRRNRVVETSENDPDTRTVVACGQPASALTVAIVDPNTGLRCASGCIGEVWVSGPTIATGYWIQPEETRRTFLATLSDAATPGDGAAYLRTGDLGFLRDGELFVTGRCKDLIIVRGRNHYPHDIENTVAGLSTAIRPGSSAAFSVESGSEERVVVVLEMPRPRPPKPAVLAGDIRQAVAAGHELQVSAVLLVAPGAIPRTSSGKIRRLECRNQYLAGELRGLSL